MEKTSIELSDKLETTPKSNNNSKDQFNKKEMLLNIKKNKAKGLLRLSKVEFQQDKRQSNPNLIQESTYQTDISKSQQFIEFGQIVAEGNYSRNPSISKFTTMVQTGVKQINKKHNYRTLEEDYGSNKLGQLIYQNQHEENKEFFNHNEL